MIAGELPQNLRMVIIDEAPELLEQFSFNDGDLNKIYSLLADNPLLMEFRQDMENIKALLADHSCRKIPSVRLVQSEIDEVIRFLFMQFQRRRISVEDFDFCLEFFQFFKNAVADAGNVSVNHIASKILLDRPKQPSRRKSERDGCNAVHRNQTYFTSSSWGASSGFSPFSSLSL